MQYIWITILVLGTTADSLIRKVVVDKFKFLDFFVAFFCWVLVLSLVVAFIAVVSGYNVFDGLHTITSYHWLLIVLRGVLAFVSSFLWLMVTKYLPLSIAEPAYQAVALPMFLVGFFAFGDGASWYSIVLLMTIVLSSFLLGIFGSGQDEGALRTHYIKGIVCLIVFIVVITVLFYANRVLSDTNVSAIFVNIVVGIVGATLSLSFKYICNSRENNTITFSLKNFKKLFFNLWIISLSIWSMLELISNFEIIGIMNIGLINAILQAYMPITVVLCAIIFKEKLSKLGWLIVGIIFVASILLALLT
ncbi:MAG: hypothetical protein FWF56_03830 [Firmicutes bacterium]|nr:hypothetical protein [Bacillota bacterium]